MSNLVDDLGFSSEIPLTQEEKDSNPSLLQSQVGEGTTYVDLEAEQVIQLARTNLDFLAGLALPEIYRYVFPAIYSSIWSLILKHLSLLRDFTQLAIGLPRGFGKTNSAITNLTTASITFDLT